MIMYHGTDAVFDKFKTFDSTYLPGHIFFTDNSEKARQFGQNVMPVFIAKVSLMIKTFEGYDVTITDPNQVKHATENLGSFKSKKDPSPLLNKIKQTQMKNIVYAFLTSP